VAYGLSGLNADELKAHFDKAVVIVKKRLNALIDALGKGDLPVDENTSLSELVASIKSGTFANKTLMVEYEGKTISLQSALEELLLYVKESDQILTDEYEELRGEIYGSDSENPTDGSLKKRVQDAESDVVDIKNALSEIPPISTTSDPNTLAKRDENGRLRTDFHGDDTSFMSAPDDEAVAMADIRQFLPYDFVLHMDSDSYVLSFTVKNAQGDELGGVQQVDLPLESVWVAAAYDAATKSIVLTTRDGNTVSVDVAAITGGLVNRDDFNAELAKKVDKITQTWKAYTTDGNGNTVAKTISANPSSGAVVLYNEGGIVKTNEPVDDNDATNRKFVNNEFLAQSTEIWALYGTGSMNAATGKAVRRMVKTTAMGTKDGYVANFRPVDAKDFDYDPSIIKCTIGVCDPTKPIQVANKRYVDGKVDPIANDVAVIWDALGGAIEYASIGSTTNPVVVPSNVFPAATIDKIGAGIKSEVENIISSVVQDFSAPGVTSSYNDGLFTFNSTEYVTNSIGFTARLSKKIPAGGTYYFFAEVVSGSYDISGEGDLFVADGMHAIKVGKLFEGTAECEISEMSTPINIHGAAVKYNNLVLRISVGEAVSVRGVPVASVKKGDETIYTVPDAIRALKYTDRPDPNDSLPVYGLAMSDTVYNYLDLEKKQYVVKCQQNFMTGELMEANATIDVSAYLTDEDGEITVAAGDEILFADADGNSVGSTVPSTITYIVKKGAS
jgi:hypothetical protein